jgi:hypothetical protein
MLYGVPGTLMSQHWIWNGAGTFDAASATFASNIWQIGAWGVDPQIYSFKSSTNQDSIPGGQLVTLCTVMQSNRSFSLYFNGSLARDIVVTDSTTVLGVRAVDPTEDIVVRIAYASSTLVTGEYPGDFQGTIHETRVYNTALTAEWISEINSEIHTLYR